MPALLNCTAKLSFGYSVTELLTLGTTQFSPVIPINPSFTALANGLAAIADSIDAHYEDNGTGNPATGHVLAPSGVANYILSALVDSQGRSIPLIDLKTIVIAVLSRTAGDKLTLGPGATHGLVALVAAATPVYDGFFWHAGKTDKIPIVVGVTDQIAITNTGANPITFSLGILGNTA